ncbi:MAG TPA: hypothetical protein VFS31_00460, partial [Chitinophagaceae bacterium]|nr:hypothetical protein [Chitinophagaceae bacterium]
SWRQPNIPGEHVKGNYIEDGPGYVFRELQQSTFYDFKVVNVCPNGVLSAGVVATQQTAGNTASGGGGGDLLWVGKLQFLSTDGQTEYTPTELPNPLIGANGVDVSVEGTVKFQDPLGSPADDRNFQLDNVNGKIIFNSPLGAAQQVIVNVYR